MLGSMPVEVPAFAGGAPASDTAAEVAVVRRGPAQPPRFGGFVLIAQVPPAPPGAPVNPGPTPTPAPGPPGGAGPPSGANPPGAPPGRRPSDPFDTNRPPPGGGGGPGNGGPGGGTGAQPPGRSPGRGGSMGNPGSAGRAA